MDAITLQQLLCFDAVVTEGGFQAASEKLRRTHPTVFAAIKNLETQLGLALFDREGYRVALTEAGRSVHTRVRVLLSELDHLRSHAAQLAMGTETELHIVIGDLCPMPQVLGLLRRFFDDCPGTRLHLHFEALAGPWERLFDGEADLIVHHVDKSDPRLEFLDLCTVQLVPVVAPGFLRFPMSSAITPEQMRDYVQCVIRDTARHSAPRSYYLIEGARSWTVSDQLMKKELILQGMGWGHLPTFLIADEVRDGKLLSIAGKHFTGAQGELVAARRRSVPHGPVAKHLWSYIAEQAAALDSAVTPAGERRAVGNPRGPRMPTPRATRQRRR